MWLSIKQVALTYLTRRMLLLYGVMVFFMQAPAMNSLSRQSYGDSGPELLMSLTFIVGFASLLAVEQGKRQFAHPRARLTPGFATPHLLVIFLVLVVAIIAYPMWLATTFGASALGTLSYSLAISASFIWALHLGSTIVSIIPLGISLGVFFSVFSPVMLKFWSTGDGDIGMIHGLIITALLATIGVWSVRLVNLNEENNEYGDFPVKRVLFSKSRAEHTEVRNALARQISNNPLQSWISDRWHDRLSRPAERPRSVVSLLRYGAGTIPIESFAVFFSCGILAVFLLPFIFANVNFMANLFRGNSLVVLMMPLSMLTLFPTVKPGQELMGRRLRMAQELLYPLERSRLIDALLRANRNNVMILWVAIHLSLVLYSLIAIPEWNLEMAAKPLQFLIVSFSLQLPAASAMMYMAGRFSSTFTYAFCATGTCFLEMVILGLWWSSTQLAHGWVSTPLFVFLLITLNFWLAPRVRSFWLRLELG